MDTTCDAKAYKLEIKRHPLNMWIADFNHAVSATCLCNSNVQYVVNHTVTPSRLTNTLLCRAVSCRVVSCRVVSCCVVSCRAVSRRVVSCCLCRVIPQVVFTTVSFKIFFVNWCHLVLASIGNWIQLGTVYEA